MRRVFNYQHAIGNKFLTCLSNVTTGLDLTDMETCYKAFRADVLKTIPLRSNRFGVEPYIIHDWIGLGMVKAVICAA